MNEISINQAFEIALKKHNQGNLKEAELIYKKIIEKDTQNHNALHLLGLINHQLKNPNKAIKKIKKAIQIKPESLYYHNLAMIYDSLNNPEKSTENFQKAIQINPSYPNSHLAHYNLGIEFQNKGDFSQALIHYNKSIELKPDFYDAYWNRALLLLLLGKFKQGWKDYEFRFKKKNPIDTRTFNKQKYKNTPLKNKKILILSEQGFGDNIQFIRYLPLLKKQGAYIILECKEELKPLFENLKEADKLIIKNKEHFPDFDFYIHIMSLPGIFNTNLSNIPKTLKFNLKDSLSAEIKKEFNTSNLKIGIAWKGNPNNENNRKRSTNLENFKLLKNPGIKLFSLQKGETSEQINDSEIINLNNYLNNFLDTANIINHFDLIITVDTSIAHLSGTLNKPTWTLIPYIPDWRWGLNKKTTPWYPSMRLFRQESQNNWKPVFEKIKKELKNLTLHKPLCILL